jgi:hypothetical protein
VTVGTVLFDLDGHGALVNADYRWRLQYLGAYTR